MKLLFQLILTFFLFGAIDSNAQTLNKPILEQSLESETLSGFQSFTNVVIFIRFKDEVNYEAPFTLFDYEDMFNKEDDLSLKHFFLEASYGKLNINSLLLSNASNQIIFYTDIYDRNYYEPKSQSNSFGYDDNDDDIALREHGLLKRAVEYVNGLNLIDSSINLDVNQDGDIDSLTFMVSGEDSGWSSLLWPHQWNLYTYYDDIDAPKINGLKAYTYTLNLLGNSKDYAYAANVGILAHETFHLLGAPDLYHYYGYDYIENAGPWALMDSNNSIPVHMLGYLKYTYGGWIDNVTTITEPGRYTLGPVKDSPNHLLRFDTGYSNEYVYFEFRVKEGFYESSLPSEGLLVYRVDKDFYGNQDGYSETSNGPGMNEVFIFRPYIKDILEPITFPDNISDESYDGNVRLAALSQFNTFNEANTTTDFLMFHSDGTLMDIRVTNVIVNNGVVSFTISFEKEIKASLEVGGFTLTKDDYLIDHELFIYEGVLNGAEAYDIYMSFDGNEATSNDTLYNGSFTFNSSQKIIHLAFYKEGIKYGDQELVIPFASSIESKHNPYGNDVYISFYIPKIDNLKQLTLTFNSFFELEDDFDFLYISTSTNEYAHTGTSLKNQVLDLTSYEGDIWIEFVSDESEDEFYGFLALLHVELIPQYTYEDIITLVGSTVQNISLGSIYNELGLNVLSGFEDTFTFKITHTIDTNKSQTYQVTYEVFEGLVLVYTLFRTVNVLEALDVSFDQILDQTFELGSEVIDFKTLVKNVFVNTSHYDIFVTHDIDFMKTGSYEVVITVVDDYNYESSQSFSVDIKDTTKPLLRLNASVDTILKSSAFIDSGISVTELNTYEEEVIGTVFTDIVGRYELTYKVTDGSNNVSDIKRIVFVIDNSSLELYIEKAVTTYTFGNRVEIPMCHVLDQEELTCEHDADLIEIQQLGTHIITYSYTKDGITSYKVLYIFVIPIETYTPVIMPKREEYNI